MKNLPGKLTFVLLSISIILTTACGSSGGGGSSAPPAPTNATISAANAQALATAGTEGVKQAAANSNTALFAKTANQSPVQRATVLLVQKASQDPTLASHTPSTISASLCPSGGNITGFDSLGASGGIVTFNACNTGAGIINGTMTVTSSTSGNVTNYTIKADITLSYLGNIETIKYSSTCTIDQSTGAQSCTYDSSGTGIDGRTYAVSDIKVSGNDTIGYTVSARVTDPDNGVITITTTTPVTFTCTNSVQPSGGVIVVSDGSNTMTVTFDSCTGYTINFNGSTTTYTW